MNKQEIEKAIIDLKAQLKTESELTKIKQQIEKIKDIQKTIKYTIQDEIISTNRFLNEYIIDNIEIENLNITLQNAINELEGIVNYNNINKEEIESLEIELERD